MIETSALQRRRFGVQWVGRRSRQPFRASRQEGAVGERSGLQRLDGSIEARLVPGSFVLVQDATVSHAIDDRHREGEGLGRRCVIARLDGRNDALDVGAHHGALAGIMTATLLRLLRALACLRAVSQEGLPKVDSRRRDNMPSGYRYVNRG